MHNIFFFYLNQEKVAWGKVPKKESKKEENVMKYWLHVHYFSFIVFALIEKN